VADSSSSGEGQKDASICRSDTSKFRLTKKDKILRSADYRRITREGVRYRTPHFYIRMLENPQGLQRLGIAAGRKVGNACARNRIKRRLREYFRLNRDKIPPRTDLVLIPFSETSILDTKQLFEELNRFFETNF
jgi:ribonuclease P protein component